MQVRSRRAFVRPIASVATAVLAMGLLVAGTSPAKAQLVAQAAIVSDNPAGFTPNILDGRVNTFAQVGGQIIAGGSFTQVQASSGGPTLARNNLIAFDANTGAVSATFAPMVAGEVYDVEPAGDGTSVYVVGSFTQVNGTTTSRLTRLNVSNGQKVAGFNPPAFNGTVKNVDLVGGQLLLGGTFSSVGGQSRSRLASLDPGSGVLTAFLDLAVSGTNHGGGTQVLKMEVAPDGQRLVIIGNFTAVEGLERLQIAMIDLTGGSATLTSWATGFYTDSCNSRFNTYLRDLDFAPDGSYFVVSTTGAYRGADSPCDVITRWETAATGPGQEATWRDYTGGDTTYAVAVTAAAVYVGGHMRWMNNPYAGDQVGPGAVAREGIAALDPVNGLPLSWDPGRARGVGVFDMLATSSGLWVGSDTDRIGGETHRKIAFFPLAGGTAPPPQISGTLPTDVYLVGGAAGAADPGVLYRVNAGGPALQSADDGPDWEADTGSTSPYRNSGSNQATWSGIGTVDASVPSQPNDRANASVFASERWDPGSDPEMSWAFPVPAGTDVTVRLYLSNRCSCTNDPGERVFDVDVEGSSFLDGLDLSGQFGHEVGVMRSTDVVSDGSIDIDFTHVTENPLVNGIELVLAGSQTGGGSGSSDVIARRSFDGTSAGVTVPLGAAGAWGLVRGAFLLDETLYTGQADGTFTRRSFNGSAFGAPTEVAMYGGSFGADIPNLTGIAYAQGRIYYTLFGDSSLYWRWFSPESEVVGATPFTVSGAAALDPLRVQGMFLSAGSLYAADRTTGDLVRVGLSGTSLSGPAVTANSSEDWQARGLFLSHDGGPPPPVNQPPTARASVTCTDLTCAFSSAGSSDPEGGALSYLWDFGDGNTSSGANPSHAYAAAGATTATLTVTDVGGLTDSDTAQATPTNPPPGNQDPVAAFTYSCLLLVCEFDATSSSDPEDGAVASYAWAYEGGGSDTEPTPSHGFPSTGTYDVTLTVSDSDGATDSLTRSVSVSVPTGSDISFRGSATDAGNVTSADVPTPSGAQPGDALLLFVTSNKGLSPTGAPAGWTLVGDQTDGSDLRTTLYQRSAPTGSNLGQVSWPARTKTNLTVLAYAGASSDPTNVESGAKTTGSSGNYPAPNASVGTEGSWVISFWSLKVSGTVPAWTPPANTTARASDAGSGGGLVSGFAVDQGPVATGSYAGKTATASATTAKATGWTVVLEPA